MTPSHLVVQRGITIWFNTMFVIPLCNTWLIDVSALIFALICTDLADI